jgi:pre-rRNA-processing protein TSR2
MEVQQQFREIVENILNRWTALKLAVEHGMAGQNGLQVEINARVSQNVFAINL